MATIINDTRPVASEDSSVGMVVGLLVALVLIVLFVMYVLPSIRETSAPANTVPGSTDINITLPNTTGGGSNTGGSAGTAY